MRARPVFSVVGRVLSGLTVADAVATAGGVDEGAGAEVGPVTGLDVTLGGVAGDTGARSAVGEPGDAAAAGAGSCEREKATHPPENPASATPATTAWSQAWRSRAKERFGFGIGLLTMAPRGIHVTSIVEVAARLGQARGGRMCPPPSARVGSRTCRIAKWNRESSTPRQTTASPSPTGPWARGTRWSSCRRSRSVTSSSNGRFRSGGAGTSGSLSTSKSSVTMPAASASPTGRLSVQPSGRTSATLRPSSNISDWTSSRRSRSRIRARSRSSTRRRSPDG